MKIVYSLLGCFLVSSFVHSQNIERQVVASGGTSVSAGSVQVSYTVGEMAIPYLSAAGISLSQGFQQSNDATVSVRNLDGIEFQIKAFPNPFVRYIEIKSEQSLDNPQFNLTDATGKKVSFELEVLQHGLAWKCQLEDLPSGNYFLLISASSDPISLPLIKN